VKEEFYAVAFRKTLYESLEQLQRDLDEYLAFYNRERAYQGYRTQGRTPFQTWSIEVSSRIKEGFHNGKKYHKLHGQGMRLPEYGDRRPSAEFLKWHNENVYRS